MDLRILAVSQTSVYTARPTPTHWQMVRPGCI